MLVAFVQDAWYFWYSLVLWVILAHRNHSDFCDLKRPQKHVAISETRQRSAALRFKGVMESRWRYAISSYNFRAQLKIKSLMIAIAGFRCAQPILTGKNAQKRSKKTQKRANMH